MEKDTMQQSDHDLLIGMKVTLDAYVMESRQNHLEYSTKFTTLEARLQKLENDELISHTNNVNKIRWQSWIVPAILYVIGELFLGWLVQSHS